MADNRELQKKDLNSIIQIDKKINYSNPEMIGKIRDMIIGKGMLKTSVGKKFIDELGRLAEGENIGECFMCKGVRSDNSVFCDACLAKIGGVIHEHTEAAAEPEEPAEEAEAPEEPEVFEPEPEEPVISEEPAEEAEATEEPEVFEPEEEEPVTPEEPAEELTEEPMYSEPLNAEQAYTDPQYAQQPHATPDIAAQEMPQEESVDNDKPFRTERDIKSILLLIVGAVAVAVIILCALLLRALPDRDFKAEGPFAIIGMTQSKMHEMYGEAAQINQISERYDAGFSVSYGDRDEVFSVVLENDSFEVYGITTGQTEDLLADVLFAEGYKFVNSSLYEGQMINIYKNDRYVVRTFSTPSGIINEIELMRSTD